MTYIDWEKERARLQGLYRSMTDAELDRIASDPASLTGAARTVLQQELTSRGRAPLPDFPTPEAEAERRAETDREAHSLEPVLVRRFRDLPEATVAKGLLDSVGIESVLADDNLIRLDWLYSNFLGGVKLLTRRKDAELAKTLLEQGALEQFEVEGVGHYEQPRCPKCGSMDISLDGLHKPASYASLLVNVPIPIVDAGWRCHSCGHGWEEREEPPPVAPQ